jgi:hypothetical protein
METPINRPIINNQQKNKREKRPKEKKDQKRERSQKTQKGPASVYSSYINVGFGIYRSSFCP